MESKDEIWKDEALVESFLEDVRESIPFAEGQKVIILHLIRSLDVPVRKTLDLGCGDGILGKLILENVPGSECLFVDFSEPMLTQAQKSLGGFADRAKFMKADYKNEEFWRETARNGPFDLVISGFSIHHRPDEGKKKIYSEIYGLLSGGGMFIHLEHVASRSSWINTVSNNLIVDSVHCHHSRLETGKSREEIHEIIFNDPDNEANILAYAEDQCEWLRQIGYSDVDCYFKVFELAIFGGRRTADSVR